MASRLRSADRGIYLHTLVDLGAQAADLALEIPDMPMALTRSSTERVDMPWM
jgi:hypothetical protein